MPRYYQVILKVKFRDDVPTDNVRVEPRPPLDILELLPEKLLTWKAPGREQFGVLFF